MHDLLCCNLYFECFTCRTKTYLKPAGLQSVKTSLIAKKHRNSLKKQGVFRLFEQTVCCIYVDLIILCCKATFFMKCVFLAFSINCSPHYDCMIGIGDVTLIDLRSLSR